MHFTKFCHWLNPATKGFSPEKPPEYFKACKLLFHDEENKIVAVEMPD